MNRSFILPSSPSSLFHPFHLLLQNVVFVFASFQTVDEIVLFGVALPTYWVLLFLYTVYGE